MPGLDANTKLLLHMNGADTSTTFTDSRLVSPHTVTPFGNAQLDTAIVKWGSASGLFNASGDYLSTPTSADWEIFSSATDDQTVDLQVYHSSGSWATHESYLGSGTSTNGFQIFHHIGGFIGLHMYDASVRVIELYANKYPKVTLSTWHHVALIKVGSTYSLYVDGEQTAFTWYPETNVISSALRISHTLPFNYFMIGNLDEVRVQADNYFLAAPNSFPAAPLLLYGEGTDEDTTMSNDGYSGAVTMVGGAKLDNGQKDLNATTSMYFSGGHSGLGPRTAYLTVADTSGTDYDVFGSATDSWTIDLRVYHDNLTAYAEYYFYQWFDWSNYWFMRLEAGTGGAATKVGFRCVTGGVTQVEIPGSNATTITQDAWHHIALVKSADNYGIYVDGVQYGYVSDASTGTVTGPLTIGREAGGIGAATPFFSGYMEQVQITKGNKFGVVPAAFVADFEGADAATSYTTNTGDVVTFFGDAQLDTAQKKFGTSSLLLDGNDYVRVPDDAKFSLGTNDWTLDFWHRFLGVSGGSSTFYGQRDAGTNSCILQKGGAGAGHKLGAYWTISSVDVGSFTMTNNWAPNVDQWYHIAYVRSGSTLYIFIDGVSQAVTVNTALGDLGNIPANPTIGTYLNSGVPASSYVNGWIDQFRITNGTALWTSDFTPPTVPGIVVPTGVLTQDTITVPTEEYAEVVVATGRSQAVIIA